MDKTVKIRAFGDQAKNEVASDKPTIDRTTALEMEHKQAKLDEERNKSLEMLKTITQLRESLKQEQAKSAELESRLSKLEQDKTAEMEAKLRKLSEMEENRFIKFNAQFEEEKKKSLEYMRTIEQLRESLKQEQSKLASVSTSASELEVKTKAIAALEAKLSDQETKGAALEMKFKELSNVMGRIANLAEIAKAANSN